MTHACGLSNHETAYIKHTSWNCTRKPQAVFKCNPSDYSYACDRQSMLSIASSQHTSTSFFLGVSLSHRHSIACDSLNPSAITHSWCVHCAHDNMIDDFHDLSQAAGGSGQPLSAAPIAIGNCGCLGVVRGRLHCVHFWSAMLHM